MSHSENCKHHHHHHDEHHEHQSTKRTIYTSIILTSLILIVTIIGGIYTKSLSLLGDATHIFTDLFSLIVSLLAIKIATIKPNNKYSYGMKRITIIASMLNILLLILSSIYIIYEAIQRFYEPVEIKTTSLFIFAVVGLIINLIILFKLHSHTHDLSVESAFWHIIGDTLSSVGVVIVSIVMMLFNNKFVLLLDPLMSILIVLIITLGVVRMSKKIYHLIMDTTPDYINITDLTEQIKMIDNIKSVDNIQIREIVNNQLNIQLTLKIKNVSIIESEEIKEAIYGLFKEYKNKNIHIEFKS